MDKKILELHKDGLRVAQISKALNIKAHYIYKVIREETKRKELNDEEIKEETYIKR